VEYGEVTRIGSSRPVRVNVRIVAATNENLPKMVDEGRFRADLLDRLSFEVITLPPLRVREGDISVLSDYFGRRMAAELAWDSWPGFGEVALRALENHLWPGNVRELRNVIERAVYRWGDTGQPIDYVQFDPFDSPWKPIPSGAPAAKNEVGEPERTASTDLSDSIPMIGPDVSDFRLATEAYEKAVLEQALAKHRYNQRQTAKALNLSYDQLRHTLKKHDLLG
jgi:psp operon transcriptional activator